MASGQRCGAASDLTLKEFDDGMWTQSKGRKVYVTRTLHHKTSSGGPAKLMWDKDIKDFTDTYIEKLRSGFCK